MNNYRRSKLSKHLEETHHYTMDLERITLLRDKCFKMFTLEANGESRDHYELEWQRYNEIIGVMQRCLEHITYEAMPKEKKK